MFTPVAAAMLIEHEISGWVSPNSYVYSVTLDYEDENEMKFTATFSKPTETKPIADFVVRVHFTVTNFTQPIVVYQIEKQRLVRNVEFTRCFREEWLDRALEQKMVLTKTMGPTPSTRLLPENARSKYERAGPDRDDDDR
jgi:hypothetical protein